MAAIIPRRYKHIHTIQKQYTHAHIQIRTRKHICAYTHYVHTQLYIHAHDNLICAHTNLMHIHSLTVPNIILAHGAEPTSNTTAEISVTYAGCVDVTSDFMVEVKYWRNGCNNVSLPLEPLGTSVFVLCDLIPGSVYWYEIRVTGNSSGAQIGDTVTGTLSTVVPSASAIATHTATPFAAAPTITPPAPTSTCNCEGYYERSTWLLYIHTCSCV